jgi:DNA mismatch repair protein MutL
MNTAQIRITMPPPPEAPDCTMPVTTPDRASTTVAGAALGAATSHVAPSLPWASHSAKWSPARPVVSDADYGSPYGAMSDNRAATFDAFAAAPSARVEPASDDKPVGTPPLGVARAQVHETYIIAQTVDGMVIVDQHAAHERLVYERMKAQMAGEGVKRQALLIPEIVELSEEEALRVLDRAAELEQMGLEVEPFGRGAVAVRATPALFGPMDVKGLIRDLADDFAEYEAGLALKERMALKVLMALKVPRVLKVPLGLKDLLVLKEPLVLKG